MFFQLSVYRADLHWGCEGSKASVCQAKGDNVTKNPNLEEGSSTKERLECLLERQTALTEYCCLHYRKCYQAFVRLVRFSVCPFCVVLGWLKSSFRFFHNILWKNSNELSGQPNILFSTGLLQG